MDTEQLHKTLHSAIQRIGLFTEARLAGMAKPDPVQAGIALEDLEGAAFNMPTLTDEDFDRMLAQLDPNMKKLMTNVCKSYLRSTLEIAAKKVEEGNCNNHTERFVLFTSVLASRSGMDFRAGVDFVKRIGGPHE